MRVTSKRQMYQMLIRGLFGNIVPQFLSLDDWHSSSDCYLYPYWGVRSLVPSGPCQLNVPRKEVFDVCMRPEFQAAGVNIGCMVDTIRNVSMFCDVYDSDTGLMVYCVEYPRKGCSWRAEMPSKGKQYSGIRALAILKAHLNESSLSDLMVLRDQFLGHVYELSAFDYPFGSIPGRNAVIWEVRDY